MKSADGRSAFGIDHGISKAFGGSILGQATKASHGVGAGQMSARGLNTGPRAKGNYSLARAKAKKEGQRGAKQFAQLGTPKSYGGYESAHPGIESANTGWAARGASHTAISKPAGQAPAGMRGPLRSRVQTSAMRQANKNFL